MKNFSSPFRALVELKQLGCSIVAVRVVLPNNLCHYDAACLSWHILDCLVESSSIVVHSLDDGTFILCKSDVGTACRDLALSDCVSQKSDVINFPGSVVLEDGKLHDVTFSLDHVFDERRDCFVNHSRVIDLRGVVRVVLDVDDDGEALDC